MGRGRLLEVNAMPGRHCGEIVLRLHHSLRSVALLMAGHAFSPSAIVHV